jgi:hypothetical protein
MTFGTGSCPTSMFAFVHKKPLHFLRQFGAKVAFQVIC